MGIRGPKISGRVKPTRKGYIRRYFAEFGKILMEHRVVWIKTNGPIPEGFDVHHVNHNKTDNRIENLTLVSKLEHKRTHSQCYRNDKGEWIKPCCKCGNHKEITKNYYRRKDGISPWCKRCCIENAIVNKRLRKARQRASNY